MLLLLGSLKLIKSVVIRITINLEYLNEHSMRCRNEFQLIDIKDNCHKRHSEQCNSKRGKSQKLIWHISAHGQDKKHDRGYKGNSD